MLTPITSLRFNTRNAQIISETEGKQICVYTGKCARCGRNCYHWKGDEDPDPRGAIPPRHTAAHLDAKELDMEGERVLFCWDCLFEHDSAGYAACVRIAEKRGQWTRVEATSETCVGG